MWKKLVIVGVLGTVGAGALLSLTSCSSTPNRNPTGELFPEVQGTALDGASWSLPGDLRGAPAVLLIGYVQNAQFDGDRWLLGILQVKLDVRVFEVPTIDGLIPGLIAGTIDDGMREGIPSEDWASVVTVYDEADRIVALTGNETPRNMRVMLLDASGRIRWFHDRGYSAGKLLELQSALTSLKEKTAHRGQRQGGPELGVLPGRVDHDPLRVEDESAQGRVGGQGQ